jgi:hypothetical protein
MAHILRAALLLILLTALCLIFNAPAAQAENIPLPAAEENAPAAAPEGNAPAVAPTAAPKENRTVVVVQLPLALQGDFKPVTDDELQKAVEKYIEAAIAEVDVIVPDPRDDRVRGMDIFGDLTVDDAAKIVRLYNARFATWGSMRFSKEKKLMQPYPDSTAYQYMITVTGVADVKVFDGASGEIVLEQRMIQGNNCLTWAIEGSPAFAAHEKTLAQKCVVNLAENMVTAIIKRLQQKNK